MHNYDQAYKNTQDVFGSAPESILVDYLDGMDRSRPILDIGAGQGRHAFTLARNGFTVHALDPSAIAIAQITRIAREHHLDITPFCRDIFTFDPVPESYSGILIFGLLQILSRDQIQKIIHHVTKWLIPGGRVFITAFGVDEAVKCDRSETWRKVGQNAYADDSGEFRTFLEPNEILTLFTGFSAIHHWEGPGKVHRHGDGQAEQHAMVEAVLELI